MTETNGSNGSNGSNGGAVDEHFLRKYRQLLDAEGQAFDELEHAYEDGDRAHFDADFLAWQEAAARRRVFLERNGLAPSSPIAAA
jgi:hypothetical protein